MSLKFALAIAAIATFFISRGMLKNPASAQKRIGSNELED